MFWNKYFEPLHGFDSCSFVCSEALRRHLSSDLEILFIFMYATAVDLTSLPVSRKFRWFAKPDSLKKTWQTFALGKPAYRIPHTGNSLIHEWRSNDAIKQANMFWDKKIIKLIIFQCPGTHQHFEADYVALNVLTSHLPCQCHPTVRTEGFGMQKLTSECFIRK